LGRLFDGEFGYIGHLSRPLSEAVSVILQAI
jgi:hypothetical protein